MPKDMSELQWAAEEASCRHIGILDTDEITDLGPLASQPAAATLLKTVSVGGAANLADVSGAEAVRAFTYRCSPDLESIDIGVARYADLGCPDLPSASVTAVKESASVSLAAGTLGSVRLKCASSDCSFSVSLQADLGTDTAATLSEGARVESLFINTAISIWEPLVDFGVPDLIIFKGEQNDAVMREYRAWLEQSGFTGEITHCPTDNTCVDL